MYRVPLIRFARLCNDISNITVLRFTCVESLCMSGLQGSIALVQNKQGWKKIMILKKYFLKFKQILF